MSTSTVLRSACALNNASQRHQKLVFLAASGNHDADLALILVTSSSLNCSSSAKTGNSLVRSPELVTYPSTIFFRYTPSAAFTPASRCFCLSPSILRLCNSACANSVRLRSSFNCACNSFVWDPDVRCQHQRGMLGSGMYRAVAEVTVQTQRLHSPVPGLRAPSCPSRSQA